MKPRVFLGSSGQQERLLKALTRGLQDVADVDPWTTVFNPGVSTSSGLSSSPARSTSRRSSSPRTIGRRKERRLSRPGRGFTARQRRLRSGPVRGCARHPPHVHPPRERRQAPHRPARVDLDPVRPRHHAGDRAADQPEAAEGDRGGRPDRRLEGDWWQLSLTARTEFEPSSISLLTISRGRAGALEVAGRAWQADGTLSARYWSEASKERVDPAGIFYFWNGERPRHPNAPQLWGTGEIKLESLDRADGYWTTRSDGPESSRHGPPGSTSVPTRATRPSWTAPTPPGGRHSSTGVSRSGGLSLTPTGREHLDCAVVRA